MRLYGKRIMRRAAQRAAGEKVETRNAVLWDILSADERTARVKIQGSNELITAFYSHNWSLTPNWLKPGNSVRVLHVSGLRGRVEIIGDGGTIPTPVSGGGNPTIPTGGDGILTGMQVRPTRTPSLCVIVAPGTYRISGTIYSFPVGGGGVVFLGDGMLLGSGVLLGETSPGAGGTICITAFPATNKFRYDLIAIGADGVLDMVTGTEATADPVIPATPAGHVKVAHILLWWGQGSINGAVINATWLTPAGTRMTMTLSDDDLAWGENTSSITLQVFDQYDHAISQSVSFSVEIVSGDGTLSGGSGSATFQEKTGAGSATFTYTRGTISPRIEGVARLITDYAVQKFITLRDINGDILM